MEHTLLSQDRRSLRKLSTVCLTSLATFYQTTLDRALKIPVPSYDNHDNFPMAWPTRQTSSFPTPRATSSLHMKTVGRKISLKTIKHPYQTQSYERDLENVGVGNRGQTPDESVEHGDDGTGDDGWDTVNIQNDP